MSTSQRSKRRKISSSAEGFSRQESEQTEASAPTSSHLNEPLSLKTASATDVNPIERVPLLTGSYPQVDDSSLCDFCSTMFLDAQNVRRFLHQEGLDHCTPAVVKLQAEAGCIFCSLICKRFSRKWSQLERVTSKFILRSEYTSVKKQNPALDYILCAIDGLAYSSFNVFAASYDSVASIVARRVPVQEMVSDATFQHAKGWINQCLEKHTKCPRRSSTVLPSRLIDVGCNDPSFLKLHISTNGEQGNYVALSYCWGGPQAVTTTVETLADHQQGLLLSVLPKTVRDAVFVTRKLGFKYLWIDSLCIVQDDAEDKAKEISSMGTVYKNATVTVAAQSAVKASDGFLHSRDQVPCCHIPFLVPKGSMGYLWVGQWRGSVSHPPLIRRAWTLQESLLSPRILGYEEQELTWQCQSERIRQQPLVYRERTLAKRLPSAIFEDFQEKKAQSQRQLLLLWASIISDYSQRNSSFFADKLNALAGIASELQKIWKNDYAAGHWLKPLVHQLAWARVFPRQTEFSRPNCYRAPSWSWASVDGEVTSNLLVTSDAEVVECNVIPLSDDAPLAEVRAATLVIKISMFSVKTADKEIGGWEFHMDSSTPLGPEEVVWNALLGWTHAAKARGLVLVRTSEGSYTRIGMFEIAVEWAGVMEKVGVRHARFPDKQEIITII